MSELIRKAKRFAIMAHDGQLRKYKKEPYWHHLHEVAGIVADVGTPAMIAAAWLHDTVEDTHVTHDDIEAEFGPVVAEYVYYLTDIAKPEDGNRAARKKIDREHNASGPKEVHTIKMADLISNSRSIFEHDPNFAKVYVKEKIALMELLTEANGGLRHVALKIIGRNFPELTEEVNV
jgi:(p)ppGpp synthase/HD superfamily hydrolase